MQDLSRTDKLHLQAAVGWLELGDWSEADAELECITPSLRAHPDVLAVRWQICAHAKKWEACMDIAEAIIKLDPSRTDGWIHRSFALHEIQHTQEAFDKLRPVAKRFPSVWKIPYNLACYCSQLRRFEEAEEWLKKAMAI